MNSKVLLLRNVTLYFTKTQKIGNIIVIALIAVTAASILSHILIKTALESANNTTIAYVYAIHILPLEYAIPIIIKYDIVCHAFSAHISTTTTHKLCYCFDVNAIIIFFGVTQL